MIVLGKSRTIFFPSNTLIYGISRDGSKNVNIRTCEHMILGQLRMGARQAKNAPLTIASLTEQEVGGSLGSILVSLGLLYSCRYWPVELAGLLILVGMVGLGMLCLLWIAGPTKHQIA